MKNEFRKDSLKTSNLLFMRTIILLTHLLFVSNLACAQNTLYSKFPVLDATQVMIDGNEVLLELDWKSLKIYCDSTDGQYARVRDLGDLKTYTYTKQGYTANFELTLYNDKVLEYRSHVDGFFRTNYFNRVLWIEYVESDSTLKHSEWLLSEEEMSVHYTEVIQAYNSLIGFNSRDEYGWICEYSAAGMPPKKRLAILKLIEFKRRDFIIKLLDHPNLQTQLYAADALIYLDIIGRIQEVELENFNGRRKSRKYYFKKIDDYKLSSDERNKIKELKEKKHRIIICGNMGSYKQYESSTSELLSDDSIDMIYSNYLQLKDLGYLRH